MESQAARRYRESIFAVWQKIIHKEASDTTQVRQARWSPENTVCFVSAYRIMFEKAEEHTGLTNKKERNSMKKRRMKAEKTNIIGFIIYIYIYI